MISSFLLSMPMALMPGIPQDAAWEMLIGSNLVNIYLENNARCGGACL